MKPLTKRGWDIVNSKDDFEYQGKSPKQVQDSKNAVCYCAVVLLVIVIGCLIFK